VSYGTRSTNIVLRVVCRLHLYEGQRLFSVYHNCPGHTGNIDIKRAVWSRFASIFWFWFYCFSFFFSYLYRCFFFVFVLQSGIIKNDDYITCGLWKCLQNKMIEEQRASVAQLNTNRSQLAAERAEFDVRCRLRMEEQQNKLTRTIQVWINTVVTFVGKLYLWFDISTSTPVAKSRSSAPVY